MLISINILKLIRGFNKKNTKIFGGFQIKSKFGSFAFFFDIKSKNEKRPNYSHFQRKIILIFQPQREKKRKKYKRKKGKKKKNLQSKNYLFSKPTKLGSFYLVSFFQLILAFCEKWMRRASAFFTFGFITIGTLW